MAAVASGRDMSRDRWFRGDREGRERLSNEWSVDWLTLAEQHGIGWLEARELHAEALSLASRHEEPHLHAERIYRDLLEQGGSAQPWRPSPGKVASSVSRGAEAAGTHRRSSTQRPAPGRITLSSQLPATSGLRAPSQRGETRARDGRVLPAPRPGTQRASEDTPSRQPDDLIAHVMVAGRFDRRDREWLLKAFGLRRDRRASDEAARETPDQPREEAPARAERAFALGPLGGRDALEQEAEALARDGAPDTPVSPLKRPAQAASAAEVALVRPALGGGEPLAPAVRASLARRLGDPLDDVRVHADARADAVARALGARAWSFGRHIGLGAESCRAGGHPSLMHEAIHAAQQRVGPSALLHDRPTGVTFHFSVHVDREMTSNELLVEFVRQYARLASTDEAEAARVAGEWHWAGAPQVADARAVKRGHVLIRVRDRSLAPATPAERAAVGKVVSGMDEGERHQLHHEVDRRFWDRTQYRPDERLGDTGDDRKMSEYWRVLRDDMVRTRQDILALPEHVRAVLFDPAATGRRLTPARYEVALRVGQKLAALSVIELTDWKSRTRAATDDWDVFEASIDRYLAKEATHREEKLQLGQKAAQLYGLEALYALRDELVGAERLATLPGRDEFGVGDPNVATARSGLPALRTRVAQALRENGFASMAEFEARIAAWRAGFERETVRIGDALLERLDHTLFDAERRYAEPQEARSLASAIAGSGAGQHYAAADAAGERAIWRPRHGMDEGGGTSDDEALAAASESAAASQRGETAMRGLAGAHPLLEFPDFPRERLARAPAAEVRGIVLAYIAEHRASIESTRGQLHEDPTFIYKLDKLMAASMESQGIAPGSIYDRIIQDYISERAFESVVQGVALAIITLALTVLTAGTGTVAVVAGFAAVGVGAWQTVDAFREYARMSGAADAQLLSEDPSLAWVVMAVIGAAADVGGAVAAVRALRTAARAFHVSGDVTAFSRAVDAIPRLDARIASAVKRAAEAEAGVREQWRALVAIGGRANDVVGAVAEAGYRFMVLAWHLARRGMYRFDQYLAELQKVGLIADATGLSPAEIRALETPFQEGLQRARLGFLDRAGLSPAVRAALSRDAIDEAAAFGRFLGLEDGEVCAVLEAQANAGRLSPGELSPGSLQAAMRQRAGHATGDQVAPDVRKLPESGARTVEAAEQSYEVGVAEGRRFLDERGWRQWERWINPFEFNGRYGQGIDDVFVDAAGHLVIVEYKGGAGELATGQMTADWVRAQTARLEKAGYTSTAAPLKAAHKAGTLRGVVVKTPHGAPAGIVMEVTY
jgi:hypothetical protein